MSNFTRNAILAELEEMLKEMPFNKITVTALVARTQISPNTFYYHFQDIYVLMDEWMEDKERKFIERVEDMNSLADIMKEFFIILKSNPEIVYHVSEALPRYRMESYIFLSIKTKFTDFLQQKLPNAGDERSAAKKQMEGLTESLWYSFIGLASEYIWSHMTMDVDSVIDAIVPIYEQTIPFE